MKEQAGAALVLGPGPAYCPDLAGASRTSPWERVIGRLSWMNWRPWGTDGRDGGPGNENHLWPMRTGNCWHEALHWTTGGLSSGDGKKNLAGERESRQGPTLKGLPFSLHQRPPLLCTTGGASGLKAQREAHKPSRWGRGAGKEALECFQLRQPGLRHRAGQQYPRAMGLEHGAGMGMPLASYPMAVIPASNLRKWSLQ